MTLVVTPIAHDSLCHGSEWIVENIDLLAERVARVAAAKRWSEALHLYPDA